MFIDISRVVLRLRSVGVAASFHVGFKWQFSSCTAGALCHNAMLKVMESLQSLSVYRVCKIACK